MDQFVSHTNVQHSLVHTNQNGLMDQIDSSTSKDDLFNWK